MFPTKIMICCNNSEISVAEFSPASEKQNKTIEDLIELPDSPANQLSSPLSYTLSEPIELSPEPQQGPMLSPQIAVKEREYPQFSLAPKNERAEVLEKIAIEDLKNIYNGQRQHPEFKEPRDVKPKYQKPEKIAQNYSCKTSEVEIPKEQKTLKKSIIEDDSSSKSATSDLDQKISQCNYSKEFYASFERKIVKNDELRKSDEGGQPVEIKAVQLTERTSKRSESLPKKNILLEYE